MDAIGVLMIGVGLYIGFCAYKGETPWTNIKKDLGMSTTTPTASVAPAGSGGY
jgi:hypothetical protein